jgi:Omp85 superfamily domain
VRAGQTDRHKGWVCPAIVLLGVVFGGCLRTIAAQGSPAPSSDPQRRVTVGLGDSPLEQSPVPGGAAQAIGGMQSTPSAANAAGVDQTDRRKSEFILAPIPVSNEAIGIGLAPIVGLVFFPFRSDRVSPPSILAVAGLFTSTKTYGMGIGGQFYLKEDRYRLTLLLGGARLRYEFFGIGNAAGAAGKSIWLSQHGRAVFVQGMRRIKWNIYVGPRFVQRQLKASAEDTSSDLLPNSQPIPPISDQLNLKITSAALGLRVERDTRDDMFYPRRGSRLGATMDFFGPYMGSTFTFQNYQFEMNRYLPFGQRHVLALRAMGCGVTGETVPFMELCQFGFMGDLRGYQIGRYRDRAMFATQGEWRVSLPKRFGATLFAGVGEVAPDAGSFNAHDLLPSGGVGLRYNLSKQQRLNLRLDLAYSKTGGSWSMGVAEAF